MASSYLEVGSAGLTTLKEDLTKLAKSLHEVFELMNADMRQVGDIVPDRDTIPDLLAQVDQRHQDRGQRDLPFPELRKGGQQDEGEYHAAGPQEPGTGKQHIVNQGGDHRGHGDHKQQFLCPVFFLKRRPQQQDISHVAHQVREARVPQHMGEQADIGHRIGKGGGVGGKDHGYAFPAGQLVKDRDQGAQERKRQHQRRIEGHPEPFFRSCHTQIPLSKLMHNS